MSAQNIDCRYSLEPPRRGGSKGTQNLSFLSRNMKNNVYPFKSQFYYIKVGFKGVNIIHDGARGNLILYHLTPKVFRGSCVI